MAGKDRRPSGWGDGRRTHLHSGTVVVGREQRGGGKGRRGVGGWEGKRAFGFYTSRGAPVQVQTPHPPVRWTLCHMRAAVRGWRPELESDAKVLDQRWVNGFERVRDGAG